MSAPLQPLAVIVAIARGGVIGKNGALPWHVPEDLTLFKSVTMGHAMIMGRRTYESIGRALPGRRSIVVTRGEQAPQGCEVAKNLEEALTLARATDQEPLIIGGAKLYVEALPSATHLFLTEIDREVENGDTFLHIDKSHWREVSRRPGLEKDVTFVELVRTGAP